jgi:two-component system response regulator GlrR
VNPGTTDHPAPAPARPELKPDIDGEALAAWCGSPCLITAPSAGVVESVARRVHRASSRAAAAFLQIAARAFPADPGLLTPLCANLMQATSGGSLLLADVENLPPIVQERLMDVLDDLQRTGSRAVGPMRLIAGTTVSLRDRIAAGTFADILFYRLNVIHVVVKTLAPDRTGVPCLHVA